MTEYVATTEYGWGRGFSQDHAILNALAHTRPDDDDQIRVWLWSVEGFGDVWPGGIEADSVDWEERYLVDGSTVNRLKELDGKLERMLDDELADASVDSFDE